MAESLGQLYQHHQSREISQLLLFTNFVGMGKWFLGGLAINEGACFL